MIARIRLKSMLRRLALKMSLQALENVIEQLRDINAARI